RALDIAGARTLAGQREAQRLWFRHSANCKRAGNIKGGGTRLFNFRRMKCNVRIVFGVEEIFALQLAVLQAAAGIHAGGVHLDVQSAGGDIWRREFQSGLPLLENSLDRHGGLHVESNLEAAGGGGDLENGDVRRGGGSAVWG